MSVDPKFRLVRGAYPYVLAQLLSPEGNKQTPAALENLLLRLLTVDGEGMYAKDQSGDYFSSSSNTTNYI